MCGIAGLINEGGIKKTDSQSQIKKMTDAIVHRGPDEDGYLQETGIGLANRRLSIVGLKDGRQPIFNEDQSRLRKGHGAKNMAVVRHFALNLVRTAKDRHSLKTRRKLAGWNLDYLAALLGASAR